MYPGLASFRHFFRLALVLVAIGVHDCVFRVFTAKPGVVSITLNWTSMLAPVGITVSKSSSSDPESLSELKQ